jgi:hypothetical protein
MKANLTQPFPLSRSDIGKVPEESAIMAPYFIGCTLQSGPAPRGSAGLF